jgi:hypothetical protein
MSKSCRLIAVMDEEGSVAKALDRLLRSAGLYAETFTSGREFLHSLQDHAPDCVVLGGSAGIQPPLRCTLGVSKQTAASMKVSGATRVTSGKPMKRNLNHLMVRHSSSELFGE